MIRQRDGADQEWHITYPDASLGGSLNSADPLTPQRREVIHVDSEQISITAAPEVNRAGGHYVAWLFGSLPGVSEVGSYRGDGSGYKPDQWDSGNRLGSVSASTTFRMGSGTLNMGFDGILDNQFYIGGGQSVAGKEIRFDFIQDSIISGIRIQGDAGTQDLGRYEWQYSEDGVDWITLQQGIRLYTGSLVEIDLNPAETPHRFYRFRGVSAGTDAGRWLREINFRFKSLDPTSQLAIPTTTAPRFLLLKRIDGTGAWLLADTVRGMGADNDPLLALDSPSAEVADENPLDIEANGVVVRQTPKANLNVDGGNYLYLAVF